MKKQLSDGVWLHVLGQKFFRNAKKNTDLVTYDAAKKFALYAMYCHFERVRQKNEQQTEQP